MGRILIKRFGILCEWCVLFAILSQSAVGKDQVSAFQSFTTNPPYLKSAKFWVHNTPQRMGDSSRSNFFQLYDCTVSGDYFLIRYFQEENGLHLDFDHPDYIHLKQGPLYFSLGPTPAVNYWFDNKSKSDEPQNTLRGSRDGDDLLLAQIFNMGITDERAHEFTWKGNSFKVLTDSSKVVGQLFVTNGMPNYILMTDTTLRTREVDDYKIDYSWPTGAVSSLLPEGYTKSRYMFTKWVPWVVVGILVLQIVDTPPDLTGVTASNLLAENYMITNRLRMIEYTNNRLKIADSQYGVRSFYLPPPRGQARPPFLKSLFNNSHARALLFAIILFLPALFLLIKGKSNASPDGGGVQETKVTDDSTNSSTKGKK